MNKTKFTHIRGQLEKGYLQTPTVTSASFLTQPSSNNQPQAQIVVTKVLKNPKLSTNTKAQSFYTLDKEANTLTQSSYQTTADSKVLAESYYEQNTSRKAVMR